MDPRLRVGAQVLGPAALPVICVALVIWFSLSQNQSASQISTVDEFPSSLQLWCETNVLETESHLVNFICMRLLSGKAGGPLGMTSLTHTLATNLGHCWAPTVQSCQAVSLWDNSILVERAKAPHASVKLEIASSGSFWSTKPCSSEACLTEVCPSWGHSLLRGPLFCVRTATLSPARTMPHLIMEIILR